jgi:serine/threonine-protein kinase
VRAEDDDTAASPAHFARVKALFDAVADLADDTACRQRLAELGASPAQTTEVMALVAQDRAAVTHFSAPLASVIAGASASELKPGDRLGPWALTAELGQGGMGQVFLAERADGLYEQRAAIKLLRGFAGEAALAQLARERRILATLNHPHIARLLDGGSTPLGRPYLVMEFVEGQRLDEWCAQRALPVAARLALFDQVCQAVALAHQRLVVHCDIKPGNVVVGSDGRAMLLDFGIAQLQGREGNDTVSLTPRYASPEQLAGEPATAACDIYSLGRVLDELLDAAPDAARRADEWRAIVALATAAAPASRYGSVDALRADLRRLQAHQPLQALPRRTGYLARKLLQRQWPWAVAGTAALTMAVSFTLRLVHERDRALQAENQALHEKALAQRARGEAVAERDQASAARAEAQRERDAARRAEARAEADRDRAAAAGAEARQQAATTAQVSEFMVSLFEGADPQRGGRPDASVADLVDKGRASLDEQLRGQAAVQAAMKGTLAQVYENIGRWPEALALYGEALALERTPALSRPLKEAELLSRQAVVMTNSNRHADALEPARRALALRTARLPADSLEVADAHNTLGLVLSRNRRFDDAQRHLDTALQIRTRRLGPENLLVAGTLHNLGLLDNGRDRPAAAEARYREALRIKQALLPPRHASTLNTVQALAAVLGAQQKFDEALPLLEQLVAARRALNGPNSEYTAMAEHELAVVQRDTGRTAEALVNYRRSMHSAMQRVGPRSTSVAISLNNIGGAEASLGDPAAEQSFRESLAIRRERLRPDDLAIPRAEVSLARWLLGEGRSDEARPLVAQASATRKARLAPDHGDMVDSQLLEAQLALAEGRLAPAEALLTALEPRQASLRTWLRVERWRLLGVLRLAQDRPAEAVALFAQALQLHLDRTGSLHPDTARRHLDLADAQWRAGDAAAAAASLRAAQPTLDKHHAQSPQRQRAAALAATLAGR